MSTIGIDVGGTFTDFVIYDEKNHVLHTAKVPSTPGNPAEAILSGLQMLAADGLTLEKIDMFLHGTTTTTNALIEQRGANCGLVVTRGLKGIAEVQSHRTIGPRHSVNRVRPPALLDEANIFEVTERLDRRGSVIVALAEEDIYRAAELVAARGLESVAISLLFSYTNPDHEERVKSIIEQEVPGCRVFCSSEVLPRIREWPRMSTTILDAYLEPILVKYLSHLQDGLESAGVTTKKTYLMQSNGGVMPFVAASAGGKAIHTVLSGPAAAVQAGRAIAQHIGAANLVTIDLGGTSCDIAFIQENGALEVTEGDVCGYDLYVPMLDIETIGAGGGTIAKVDMSGRLRVGPQSAGAYPGPSAYGRGGTDATITDADVALGYLNPEFFLGGKLHLDRGLAIEAIERCVAAPLGVTVQDAALAMVRLNDAHMADAIRVIAARRGVGLGAFRLVACGGAGPVHAVAVAEELGVGEVLVPESPGVFAALGLLCTDVAQDYVQTDIGRLDSIQPNYVETQFLRLEERAVSDFKEQGFDALEIRFVHEIDCRYAGQGFEIRVFVSEPGDPAVCERLIGDFHDRHEEVYGHKALDEVVEIVSYRLRAVVDLPQFHPAALDYRPSTFTDVTRQAQFSSDVYDTRVLRRSDLGTDEELLGPLIVEQEDTTTVVPPGWSVHVDSIGNLVVSKK